MSSPFSRSLRALESERHRGWRAAAIAAALLLGWGAWFGLAQVPLYETSTTARVEATAATHPVDARMTGRAIRVNLSVGASVRAGDVLLELEAEPERLSLQEARTRVNALGPEIAAIASEINAERRALADERDAARVARDEQQAVVREAQAALQLADEEAKRVGQLRAKGIISEVEDVRARAEVTRRRAAVDAAETALVRIDRDVRTRESDRRVRIERLRGTHLRLEGEAATAMAAMKRLENEVERRMLRAPIDGRIGEAAELRVGGVVREGQRIAAIVPSGPLQVVAHFTPASALGRVRPGQRGRVRLHGFPWTEYGSLRASVSSVADEIRDGLVRVELTIDGVPATLPSSHALPGTAEIEVERARPFALVLRTLGGWMTQPVARN